MSAREPLLEAVVDAPEEELVEFMDIKALIKSEPMSVISYIKEKGLKKLGTFAVKDETILKALAGRNMLTFGANTPNIDAETVWREQLNKLAPEDPTPGRCESWGASVKVSAYVVTVRNAAAPDVAGLLYPLLLRYQAGNLSERVFTLPAISAVISFKWDWFAFRLLLGELFMFLLWLLSFNVFVILFQDEDTKLSLGELLHTSKGKVTVLCEALALVGMAPFLIIEGSTMIAYMKGWFSVWNLMDMISYALQIAITYMHLSRTWASSEVLTICVSLQCIVLWLRLQYFSRVFRPTKFAFLDGLTEVFEQTKWYFFFSMLVMWGFGMSFYTLFRLDQTRTDEFDNIGATMSTMFKWMLGGADLDVVMASSQPTATLLLAVIYQFVMAMVLLNLLLGVMMQAVEKVEENQEVLHHASKAIVTDELESTLPAFLERLFGCWNPPFVHILKIDKALNENLELLLGDDDLNAVQDLAESEDEDGSDKGDDGNNGGKGDADVSAQILELKGMVEELQATLEKVVAKQAPGSASKRGLW